MRLVLLTGDDLEHRYVAQALAQAFPDALKAIVIADRPRPPLVAMARRYLRRYNTGQLCSRIVARLYARFTRQEKHRRATFTRYLGAGALTMPRPDLVRVVPSHNGTACEALLREIQPDIITVYGTAIIKPHIFRLASRCALGMHTGISPRYRGSDAAFWAIHNREPEWIGATVFVLDEGVDSGPILATGRASIAPDDDEYSLVAKCVMVGARLYVDGVRQAWAGSLTGTRQNLTSGRQYRFVDRTVWAERRVRRNLRQGLLADFARHNK